MSRPPPPAVPDPLPKPVVPPAATSAVTLQDVPVERLADDRLDRARLAAAIADQIHHAPAGASARMAVYGEWGEGKTSVLQMIDERLEAHGDVTLWLPVGLAAGPDAIRPLLLTSAASRLAIRDRKHAGTAGVRRYIPSVRAAAAEAGVAGKLANRLVGDAVEKWIKKLSEAGEASLLEKIREALGQRRLVILVDDLDRVRAEGLPSILLALHELALTPDISYVLALAPRVVQEGLARLHYTAEDARQFLEKIVELPVVLPEVSEAGFAAYIARQLHVLGGAVRADTVRALATLLPRNPRRAKLVLRHWASLRALWARFDDDEVDWWRAYLAQMLALELPDAARALRADADAMHVLDGGMDHGADGGIDARPDVPAGSPAGDPHDPARGLPPALARHAPPLATLPDARRRYARLVQALRHASQLASAGLYPLSDLLGFSHAPPRITRREATALRDVVLGLPREQGQTGPPLRAALRAGVRAALGDALSAASAAAPGRALEGAEVSAPSGTAQEAADTEADDVLRAFWHTGLAVRHAALERADQVDLAEDAAPALAEAAAWLAALDRVVAGTATAAPARGAGAVGAGTETEDTPLVTGAFAMTGATGALLGAAEWRALYEHAREWASLDDPAAHDRRAAERTLTREALDALPPAARLDLARTQPASGLPRAEAASPEFDALASTAEARIQESAALAMLSSFRRAGGLEALWLEASPTSVRLLLFSDSSPLLNGSGRAELRTLAASAAKHTVVRGNFIAYALLWAQTLDKAYGPYEHVAAVERVADHELLGMVWTAAVGPGLLPRTVARLERFREQLLHEFDVPITVVPVPRWWRVTLHREGADDLDDDSPFGS